MNNCSVYKHTNKINGKVYIGMTTMHPKERWKNGAGYSGRNHFGRAIRKYGWNSFEHEIVETGLTRDEALKIEKMLIAEYDSTNPEKGYNEAVGGEGGGMYKKHHTAESKEKISKARKRDGFSEQHKANISKSKRGAKHHLARPLYQYSEDGEFIRKWDYSSEPTKVLGINKANIAEVCNGKRKTAGGYVWSHEMR